MAAFTPVVERYVGDDWTLGPIALTAGGVAMDLTGSTVLAEVYARDVLAPVAVLAEVPVPGVGGLTAAADRTSGLLTELWVAAIVTAAIKPQDRREARYPTRIDILVRDSRGRTRTVLIVLMRPLDRRSDAPAAP